jgi:hypothetical protein
MIKIQDAFCLDKLGLLALAGDQQRGNQQGEQLSKHLSTTPGRERPKFITMAARLAPPARHQLSV